MVVLQDSIASKVLWWIYRDKEQPQEKKNVMEWIKTPILKKLVLQKESFNILKDSFSHQQHHYA